jgi:hypothetical protein
MQVVFQWQKKWRGSYAFEVNRLAAARKKPENAMCRRLQLRDGKSSPQGGKHRRPCRILHTFEQTAWASRGTEISAGKVTPRDAGPSR